MEADVSQHSVSHGGTKKITGFLPRTVRLADERAGDFVAYSGMMPEQDRIWTLGPISNLAFALPPMSDPAVLIRFHVAPFIWDDLLPRQRVQVRLGDIVVGNWELGDRQIGRRAITIRREDIPASRVVPLTFDTPDCARPSDLGINGDERPLGIGLIRIEWEPAQDYAKADALARLYGRRVGHEARKSFDDKLESGFWNRYIGGQNVLDIGFKGYDSGVVPIVDGAVGIDLDFPGYDGLTLPFADESQDTVYSSHCLEHIPNHLQIIRDWYRVTKVGGHIITVVPHAMLYERKRRPPSRWAGWNHQRFYTPQSLLAEFECALVPNSFRVRHLAENDANYSYDYPTERHPDGCYEIELVIEKIGLPAWSLDD
jgi:SAM-dependent methyltransferase